MIDYDPHDWRSHLLDIRGSLLREIIVRVLACVAWTVVVTTFHKLVYPVAVPSIVHSLVGPALALLLVFRTNSSYDRFWEGRRMWGGIVNESRNLARLANATLEAVPYLRDRAVLWTICLVYGTMYSLRAERNLGPQVDRLPQDDVQRVLAASHVPLAAAGEISKQWIAARDAGAISDYLVVALDRNVDLIVDYIGACERIHKTPLPFAYMVHLRRAILLFCYTLPFAIVKDFGWSTILCTMLVAYILTGIEEIGVEIEDPFGDDDNDLPMEAFCQTIERDLLSTISEAGRGV